MDIMELLKGRRTYRRFKQTPVPQEVVEDILEAARLANCSRNKQTLRYLVIDKPEDMDEVFACTTWAAALPPEQGRPKSGEQPVLYIAVLKDAADGGMTDVDAGLAVGNMTLAAWAKGVGSCILGAINRPRLAKLFGLGDTTNVHLLIAFGYPSHKSTVVPAENGELSYYLDENRDYCVPKYAKEEIVTYK